MIRSATALLLMFVVGVCPLICLSQACLRVDDARCCAEEDDCCESGSDSKCPENPNRQDAPKTCLCGGAVLDALPRESVLPVLAPSTGVWLLVATPVNTLFKPSVAFIAAGECRVLPVDGRSLLALLGRLLL